MSDENLFTRVRASGHLWNSLLVVLDSTVVVLATVVAYYARFEGQFPTLFSRWIVPLIIVSLVVYLSLFAVFGLYRLLLRFVGVDTLLKLGAAVSIAFATLIGMVLLMPLEQQTRPVPFGVLFFQAVLVFLGAAGARMAARVYLYMRSSGPQTGRRVLIVGAGSAGSLLLREIQNRPDLDLSIVGFLDDESALRGRTLGGVKILGGIGLLGETVSRLDVEEVIVALPSAPRETVRAVLNAAADAGVQTRIMPTLVVEKGSVSLRDLRSVEVEDLLGREATVIDVEQVRETVADKVVAVTGAAGSIGSELCRQIVALGPRQLLLMELDETRLYELWLELEGCAPGVATMSICDVRDASKVDSIIGLYRPDLLLHAAAYKHVPLMELEPAEAVKTNVMGTLNVIDSCAAYGVGKFVLVSTDKAVAPANTMGLTKSLAERVMLDATKRCDVNAVAVRFGNVLASRGSVVPIFEEQLRHGGPLTVTDPEVTRYFMTIPEAARLVLQAQALGAPGDIFVLEMGEPVKIVDLARKMIALSGVPADIEFIGLRAGEKLHEVLTTDLEKLLPTEREKVLRVDRVWVPEPEFQALIVRLGEAAFAGRYDDMSVLIDRLEPGFGARERMA